MDKRVDGEERRRKKIERCREFRETKKKTDPDWNAKEASRLKVIKILGGGGMSCPKWVAVFIKNPYTWVSLWICGKKNP